MQQTHKCVVIIGPTASGKTALAHAIFDWLQIQGLDAELINLDAFQFYKSVDAGTAKPTPHERTHYKYHGIDILEPHESFDAQKFAAFAHAKVAEVSARQALPICVGGSGLYLRAFLHGLDELPSRDDDVRNFIRNQATLWGWPVMHRVLTSVDATRAAELHPNDKTRIERALEIFYLTGQPPSQARSKTSLLKQQQTLLDAFVIHVDLPDAVLRKNITDRVPLLFNEGWFEEVRMLKVRYGDSISQLPSFRAIGYVQVANAIDSGLASADTKLVGEIATLSWQYARRQRTWNAKEQCQLKVSDANRTVTESISKGLLSFLKAQNQSQPK